MTGRALLLLAIVLALAWLYCGLALVGCGDPRGRPAPPGHVSPRVVGTLEEIAAVHSWEHAYLAEGLPILTREITVRVLYEPGITPRQLPAGTAAPGARGGTWSTSGDVDLADPRHAPHEFLHAAKILAGEVGGDLRHADPLWLQHGALLEWPPP
jgi:hypothetical protein